MGVKRWKSKIRQVVLLLLLRVSEQQQRQCPDWRARQAWFVMGMKGMSGVPHRGDAQCTLGSFLSSFFLPHGLVSQQEFCPKVLHIHS